MRVTAAITASVLLFAMAAGTGCEHKKKQPDSRPAPVYLVLPPINTVEPPEQAPADSAQPAPSAVADAPRPTTPARARELSPEAWLQRAAVAAWSGENDRERATGTFSPGGIGPDERTSEPPESSASSSPAAVSSADIDARIDARLAEEREKQRQQEQQDKQAQAAKREQEQKLEAQRQEAQRIAERKQVAATYGAGPGFTWIGGGTGFTGFGAGAGFTGYGAGSGYTGIYGSASTTYPQTPTQSTPEGQSSSPPLPVFLPVPVWWIPVF